MKTSFFKEIARKFVKAITPPPIGGLFITDWSFEYLGLEDAPKIIAASSISMPAAKIGFLRLPPGIIEGGRIKDRPNFIAALKELHGQLTADANKVISVILSLPARDVYVQTFNLPRVAEKNLNQAADLNAKMISPIPIDGAYYSWQKTGESIIDGGQLEFLGAFISKSIVDEFTEALRAAGFGVAVVEFSSLSLARNLNALGLLDKSVSYLLVEFNSSGLNFLIIKNNNLYFAYFYSWHSVQGTERTISLDALEKVLREEIQKILNFYSGRWGGQIKNFIIVAPGLHDELLEITKRLFGDKDIQVLPSRIINPVLGASLRGLLPRVRDFDITLTSVSVAETFLQDQVLNFVSVLRNILISTFGFLLLVFVASEIFLIKTIDDLKEVTAITLKPNDQAQLVKLQGEAVEFNKLVSFVKYAKDKKHNLSPLLKLLLDFSGTRVRLDRISLPQAGSSGTITGETDSEEAAIEFKNKVAQIPQLGSVDLPLNNLITKADGRVIFTLNFKTQSLNF